MTQTFNITVSVLCLILAVVDIRLRLHTLRSRKNSGHRQ